MHAKQQIRRLSATALARAVSALILTAVAGCGGGKGLTNPLSPPSSSTDRLTVTRFDVDTLSGKVQVTSPHGSRAAKGSGRAIFNAGAVTFASTDLITVGGDSGQRELTLQLSNNTAQILPATLRVVLGNLLATTAPSASTIKPATSVSTLTGTGTSLITDGAVGAAQFQSVVSATGGAGPSSGTFFVGDTNTVRHVTPNGTVTTVAGQSGSSGATDGVGSLAKFSTVQQIGCDAGGNLFVADMGNHKIRRVSAQGAVTPVTGALNTIGTSGNSDGAGNAATFNSPIGIAVSQDGARIYVSDSGNFNVRLIQLTGGDPTLPASYTVSTVAGSGSSGSADGIGTAATFNTLQQLALVTDGSGVETLFVADQGNKVIRRIDNPASGGAVVTTIAGTVGSSGTTDGLGNSSLFKSPNGLSGFYLPNGSIELVCADSDSGASQNAIRVILFAASGNPVSKLSYAVVTAAGTNVAGAFADGDGTAARFSSPTGVYAAGPKALVADKGNNRLRIVNTASILQTGNGTSSGGEVVKLLNADSELPNSVSSPAWVKNISNGSGNLQFYVPSTVNGFSFTAYVEADSDVVNLPGSTSSYVQTLAGDQKTGNADGPGKLAEFYSPNGIVAVPESLRALYAFPVRAFLVDRDSGRVRAIDTSGNVTTFAGSTAASWADGNGASALFNGPYGIAIGPDGNLFVADTANYVIRRITPTGDVTTIAGTHGTSGTTDGVGNIALFNHPYDIKVDGGGIIFVSDDTGGTVRKIEYVSGDRSMPGSYLVSTVATGLTTPYGIAIDTDGKVYAINGTAVYVYARASGGTLGAGVSFATGFNNPHGISIDAAHNLYVTDTGTNTIKRVSPLGAATTIAGTGTSSFLDGTYVTATFNSPRGITLEGTGTLLVSDYGNKAIRSVQRIVSN